MGMKTKITNTIHHHHSMMMMNDIVSVCFDGYFVVTLTIPFEKVFSVCLLLSHRYHHQQQQQQQQRRRRQQHIFIFQT
jgi:hypothetical protein